MWAYTRNMRVNILATVCLNVRGNATSVDGGKTDGSFNCSSTHSKSKPTYSFAETLVGLLCKLLSAHKYSYSAPAFMTAQLSLLGRHLPCITPYSKASSL